MSYNEIAKAIDDENHHLSHQPYKYTIDDMQALAVKKDGKCISQQYKGVNTKLKWECHRLSIPIPTRGIA